MIPDLAWWGRLFGLLATEAALLVALAALVARLVRTAPLRRLVWQSAFLAVALVWTVELSGGRNWVARWQETVPAKRQLTARVVGSAPVVAEEVPFEFPAELAVPPPAPAPQPNWWPALLWLAGLGVLTARALGIRAWLAWRFRGRRRREALSEVGALKSEVVSDHGLVSSAATETVVERLRRQLRLGTVRVQAWPQLRGPVAFGIFRPTVAVPADFAERFTPVQREAMLAHELAHLANRDPLWLLVAELVCALAWWHPAVWWARRQFRAACESAADEASTLVPGGQVALAEALVNFGRELTAPGGVGVAGSGLKSELARRVKALVERTGDDTAMRPASSWVVRGGVVVALGALLLVPWPGERGGLGVVVGALRAEVSRQGADVETGSAMTVDEVLAEPRVRSVAGGLTGLEDPLGKALTVGVAYGQLPTTSYTSIPASALRDRTSAKEPWPSSDEGRLATVTARGPQENDPGFAVNRVALELKAAKLALDEAKIRYGKDAPELVSAENRFKAAELEFLGYARTSPPYDENRARLLAKLDDLRVPSFEVNGEPLDAVVRRLEQAAKAADPEGQGVNFIINEPDETGTLANTVIKAAPPQRGVRLTEVIRRVVAGAETPIQVNFESYAVVFNVWRDESKQLHTRRFNVPAKEFGDQLARFLPAGETNAKTLQLAVRAFCSTNGVEFPLVFSNAPEVTPPSDHPAIFYNDRTGQLFVRATAENLERLEQAIQQLNLPDAETDRSRAELVDRLRTTKATLGELLTRYKEGHPKVRAAAKDYFEAKRATEEPEPPQPRAREVQSSPKLEAPPEPGTLPSAPTTNGPSLFTRQFRVDTDKLLARIHAEADVRVLTNGVLAGTDPIEDAARRIEQLPNRSLSFAGGGPAPTSPGTLPRTTPAVPLGESAPSGVARTNRLANVQVTLREYFRGHGVEFPAPDSATGQPLKEPPAVFFNDRTGMLFVRAAPEDMEKVERALGGVGQPGPGSAVTPPRQSEPGQGNSQLIQTLEHDRELVTQQISRLRQDLENGSGVRSELEAKLKRMTDVETKLKEQLGHVRQAANRGDRPESGLPQVQLSVFFAEITEGSSDDIGLDWLFGKARTNNPALQSALVTNLPTGTPPLNGDRLRVDRLAIAGQSSVLSAEQFAALKERLEGRSGVDFLTAPKVITLSGRQAQVTVGDVRTLVTGVVTRDGSPTNDASVSYVTDQVSVGPMVDLFPAAEGTGWRVKAIASLTEFLGYDDPGTTNRVQAQTLGGKPLKGTAPLPRLRVRETQAEALAHPGETIALRGPLADEVIRFKDKVPVLGDVPLLGRLFRSEGTQIRSKRLYVFIQPSSIDAFGN